MDNQSLIKKHEGLRLKMYKDSRGIETIGYGFNLRANSISPDLAQQLLDLELNPLVEYFEQQDWYQALSPARQAVVLDMSYNMGLETFLSFHQFLAFLKAGDWENAAKDILGTLWAKEVGNRATEDSQIILSGTFGPS